MPRTHYPISRLIGTFFGLWAAWIQFGVLRAFLEGPPKGCDFVTCYLGFSWLDEDPAFSAITTSLCLGLYVAGGIGVWWRPRLGSFLLGMGWTSYFVCSLLSSVPHGNRPCSAEWADGFILLLAPACWSFYAGVKDEPVEFRPRT
jgi:hypothetical protein